MQLSGMSYSWIKPNLRIREIMTVESNTSTVTVFDTNLTSFVVKNKLRVTFSDGICYILILQWTFVNPRKEQSTTEAGMSLYITQNLQKYNAGVAILEETYFSLPGNLPSYSVSSACPSSCTQLQMRSPVTIVAGVNVMRHFGNQLWINAIRLSYVMLCTFITKWVVSCACSDLTTTIPIE